MSSAKDRSDETSPIRERIEDWTAALRARDVERMLSHYANDVVAYDIAPPLAHVGIATMRKDLSWWFSTFRGPIGYEIRDLHIAVGDDVAFAHCLSHMTGEKIAGELMDIWVRATIGLRKIDGEWKVTHEHSSVPLHMDGTGRGAVDLVP